MSRGILNNMTLGQKFLCMGLATLGLVMAIVGASFWATESLSGRMSQISIVAHALRNHLEADMMHDALRGDVLAALQAGDSATPADREEVLGDLAAHVEKLRTVVSANQDLLLPAEIEAAIAEISEPLDAYVASANAIVNQALESNFAARNQWPEFLSAFRALEGPMGDVSDRIREVVAEFEAAGADTAAFVHILMFVAIGLALFAAVGIALMVVRGITRPLNGLAGVISELAAGNRETVIPCSERGDEIGHMARALERIREAGTTAQRLGQMVEDMPTGVMTCDPSTLEITYLNKFSRETLASIEQHLPIKADEMMGQSIDIFHKNPAHQRALLSDPKNLPHNAVIEVGPELLDLRVTALTDMDGNYIGPMLTWSVVTEKAKADAEAARLAQMVELMPVGVMTCDPETLEINYLNKFSRETLASIEQHLPIKADQMMGQCIDIFHKNPAHQRALLGDAKNLPHRGRIEVGPEYLDLLVSPIMDLDGKYVGPMLTWSVVTDRVRLADDFEANVGNIVEAVSAASTEMQATAQTMSATADETNQKASSVAAASEEASTNVQTVASAAEELSSSIGEISRQVAESSRSTTQASEQARKTNEQVEKLADAAQKIGEVVSLISDIAEQTNLLALNATIEAARAGEAGKGFAVVASEVKSLANQTAKATEDISAQIGAIQSATSDAVNAIKEIGTTIESINEIASAVASAVEEQGAATQEIAQNVQQASAGTDEVSSNIAGVTQAASETGSAAQEVLSAASELSQQSEQMRTQVDSFLAQVRAM